MYFHAIAYLLPVILQLLLIIQMLKKLVHSNHDTLHSKKPDHKIYMVFVRTVPVLHIKLYVKDMYICHNGDVVLTWKLESTVLAWPLVG